MIANEEFFVLHIMNQLTSNIFCGELPFEYIRAGTD